MLTLHAPDDTHKLQSTNARAARFELLSILKTQGLTRGKLHGFDRHGDCVLMTEVNTTGAFVASAIRNRSERPTSFICIKSE